MAYYLDIYQKLINKNNMKNSNKLEKHIWEGWRVIDFINELQPILDNIMKNYFGQWETNNIIKNKTDLKKWCMENQPYYKKYIPEVVQYFVERYKIK